MRQRRRQRSEIGSSNGNRFPWWKLHHFPFDLDRIPHPSLETTTIYVYRNKFILEMMLSPDCRRAGGRYMCCHHTAPSHHISIAFAFIFHWIYIKWQGTQRNDIRRDDYEYILKQKLIFRRLRKTRAASPRSSLLVARQTNKQLAKIQTKPIHRQHPACSMFMWERTWVHRHRAIVHIFAQHS